MPYTPMTSCYGDIYTVYQIHAALRGTDDHGLPTMAVLGERPHPSAR
jgi:hypothetical protein